MDYAATAKGILEQVGSESNVISATHCMTRLRLVLKDESSVDDEKVKAIPGVVGVMRKSGQYQIIIGNNVAKCYAELLKLGSFSETPAGDADKKGKTGKKRVNIFSAILDAISGSIAPIIPAIIGAGMIRVLYIILNFWIPAENSTMTILNAIADAAFYFLPVLIAFAAGKKFKLARGFSVADAAFVLEVGRAEQPALALFAAAAARIAACIGASYLRARRKGTGGLRADVLLRVGEDSWKGSGRILLAFNLAVLIAAGVKLLLRKIMEENQI